MFFKWCVGEMDSVSRRGRLCNSWTTLFPPSSPLLLLLCSSLQFGLCSRDWVSQCLLACWAGFACLCLLLPLLWRKDEAWHTTACSAKTPQESWPSLSLALSFLSSVPMLLSSQHFTLCTLSLNYSGDRQPHSVKQGLLLMSNKDFFCVDLFCGEANRSFFVKVIFWSSVIK